MRASPGSIFTRINEPKLNGRASGRHQRTHRRKDCKHPYTHAGPQTASAIAPSDSPQVPRATLVPPSSLHKRTAPVTTALGTAWLDHPPTTLENQPFHVPTSASYATAETLIEHTTRTCLPSLTSSCDHLLSHLPLQGSTPSMNQHTQAQAQEVKERQQLKGVRVPSSSTIEPLCQFPACICASWVQALYEWYSMWRALSTSTESLLQLIPQGAHKARTDATRLLVQLGKLEQQLSGSSVVQRSLDFCFNALQGLACNKCSAASTGDEHKAAACILDQGHHGQHRPDHDSSQQQQLQDQVRAPQQRNQQQAQQQQQPQQQQQQIQMVGALHCARAVQQCMQQGSYRPTHERALSVVLSAEEKRRMLEDYRDQERALLSHAANLLHSREAAPEAEVSADELRDDAVLAHVAQGLLGDGGALPLTLDVCALLLRHHPDNSLRQQVYEQGVESRCLSALQLMDRLAGVRVKIARCCGYPSYDQLCHSGTLCGSSTVACLLLTQLMEALEPAAQQQLQKHGNKAARAVAAQASATKNQQHQGHRSSATAQHGEKAAATVPTQEQQQVGLQSLAGVGEDSCASIGAQIEAALLQALAPHGLDYTPPSTQQAAPSRMQHQGPRDSQPPNQQAHAHSSSPHTHSLLPPLPSLMMGISDLLHSTLGVWFELEPAPEGGHQGSSLQSGGIAMDFKNSGGDSGLNSDGGVGRYQLLRAFMGELQQPGLGAEEQLDVHHQPEQTVTQYGPGSVVVVNVHHELRGCVGAILIHPTAACGARYLHMEGHVGGLVHADLGASLDKSRCCERPVVLVGLHGCKGLDKSMQSLGEACGQAQQQFEHLCKQQLQLQDKQQQHELQMQQQQQQQQQHQNLLQQGMVLSESALCLWELMHELGHAIAMLLSWRPLQIEDTRLATSSVNTTQPSTQSSDVKGASTTQVQPVSLLDCPTQLPLELLELPSTLLELMAAQPKCVSVILAAAYAHQQNWNSLNHAHSFEGSMHASSNSMHNNSMHDSSNSLSNNSNTSSNKTSDDSSRSSNRTSNSSSDSHEGQQHAQSQQGNLLAREVRQLLYQPLRMQVQAMTALLDQLLLRRTHSSISASTQGQEAIALWVDLCNKALPLGLDPMFTQQQAQSLYRVMELRGRYVAYPVAWVLATAAWHHHGLDQDPTNPSAWRTLRCLVYENLQQANASMLPSLRGGSHHNHQADVSSIDALPHDQSKHPANLGTGINSLEAKGQVVADVTKGNFEVGGNCAEPLGPDLAWLQALVGLKGVQLKQHEDDVVDVSCGGAVKHSLLTHMAMEPAAFRSFMPSSDGY